jgi:hypothetical protein
MYGIYYQCNVTLVIRYFVHKTRLWYKSFQCKASRNKLFKTKLNSTIVFINLSMASNPGFDHKDHT